MFISNLLKLKSQVYYEESGEGVGSRDPLEGLKAQKGEITKRVEDMKKALEDQKNALTGTKNQLAQYQGRNLPEINKHKAQLEGEKKSTKVQIEGYRNALNATKEQMREQLLEHNKYNEGNPGEVRRQYEAKIREYEDGIEQLVAKLKQIEDVLENDENQLAQLKQAIAQLQNHIQQLQQSIIQIQSNITILTAQKKGLEIQLKHMAGIAIKQKGIQSGTKKQIDAIHAEQGAVAG